MSSVAATGGAGKEEEAAEKAEERAGGGRGDPKLTRPEVKQGTCHTSDLVERIP